MTVQEFRNTLSSTMPPSLPPLLVALWHDANGDWEKAHTLAQEVGGKWEGARAKP